MPQQQPPPDQPPPDQPSPSGTPRDPLVEQLRRIVGYQVPPILRYTPQFHPPIRMALPQAPQAVPGAPNDDPTPQNNTQALSGQSEIPSSLNSTSVLRSRDEFLMIGVNSVPAQPGDCTTCLEPLTTDVVQLAKCGHVFHCTCILFWFKSNSAQRARCPNCRAELFSNGAPEGVQGFGTADMYRHNHNMRPRQTRLPRNRQLGQASTPSSAAPGASTRSSRTHALREAFMPLTTEDIEALLRTDLPADLRHDYEEELSARQTQGNAVARRRSRSPVALDDFLAEPIESGDSDSDESRTFHPLADPPQVRQNAQRARAMQQLNAVSNQEYPRHGGQSRPQPQIQMLRFGLDRPWTRSLAPIRGQGVRPPAPGGAASIRPVNAQEILRSNDGAGSSRNRNAELPTYTHWPDPTWYGSYIGSADPPISNEPQERLSGPSRSSARLPDWPRSPTDAAFESEDDAEEGEADTDGGAESAPIADPDDIDIVHRTLD